MKVWIIEISDFLPEIDEGNRLFRAGMIAKALYSKGHSVLWWSSTFNHQKRCHRFSCSKTIDVKSNFRLRLLHGPGYNKSVSLNRVYHNKVTAKNFAAEISQIKKNERPDIIYTCLPTLEVSEQAVRYGNKKNIPVVVDIRELIPDNYLTVAPKLLRPLLRFFLSVEFSRAYKILHNSTAITASSPTYLNWGIKTGKRTNINHDRWFPLGGRPNLQLCKGYRAKRPFSLPNGFKLPADCFLITFVGTFTRLFDFNTVIEVARKFHNEGQNKVHFLFAGSGDKYDFLMNLSKDLDHFHLLGWCEKDMVDQILSISSVGIAPYSMKIRPTLPNKPFEYMATGLPILSSLDGELKNILKNESIGLQYQPGNSNDLKQKIEWFLDHPAETKSMGQRAKVLFETQYAENIVYNNFVNYLEILSKKWREKCVT